MLLASNRIAACHSPALRPLCGGQATFSSTRKHTRAVVAAAAAAMSAEPFLYGDTFWLDSFALRQWDDPNYSGTRISYDKAAFVQTVHEMFKADGSKLVRLSQSPVKQCR